MPIPQGTGKRPITHPSRTLAKYVRFLESHHKGHYMIWNLSEDVYDYSLFQFNVMDLKFPGYPAAPIGMKYS